MDTSIKPPKKFTKRWFQWIGSKGGASTGARLTDEQRRERARAMGLASGEARRRKRDAAITTTDDSQPPDNDGQTTAH
jgi:hypothetical protein